MPTTFRYFFALVLSMLAWPLAAQVEVRPRDGKQVEVVHTDVLEAEKVGDVYIQYLSGNVQFRQGDALMFCDSAVFNPKTNNILAFGNIHLNHADSVHLYGQRLTYDGNTKHAIITGNVSLRDHEMTLTTDRLDYNLNQKVAYYTTGGTITDAENRLTSGRGYYYASSRDLHFRKDVRLYNPKYTMESDTLQYNIASRLSKFHGPTYIRSNADLIYCETGAYHTITGVAEFGKNAYLASDGQTLSGDSLYYDRRKGYGRALGNVAVLDTSEQLLINGDFAEHFEKQRRTFITGHVLASKNMRMDSLFLTSDTLYSGYDTTGQYRVLRGIHNARIFSKDFQAKSDSIYYSFVDSTVDLYSRPVVWFDAYQGTSDHIRIYTRNNDVDRVEFLQNAFLVKPEDSLYYSQIKGRNMEGFFREGQLYRIDVNGNGESIYFVRDEKERYIGMNHLTTSDIQLRLEEQELVEIACKGATTGDMTPVDEITPASSRLPGFIWRGNERPQSVESLRVSAK